MEFKRFCYSVLNIEESWKQKVRREKKKKVSARPPAEILDFRAYASDQVDPVSYIL